ncbi:hypothetical protein HNP38_002465 [Chryseobacterium defluvii]|uniref:Uncharacterized protein n=1 Tax=Chryseobacterium defluvii TaxID=160396 RepID=A0A840KCP1_9FLAO|nr:hypothetical protein [Chryseobacterium defluvii]
MHGLGFKCLILNYAHWQRKKPEPQLDESIRSQTFFDINGKTKENKD